MIETTNSPSPQPVSDEDIERLYRQYGNDVLRVSYFYLGNREQAEDVTQDVFVRLIENRPALKLSLIHISEPTRPY